MLVLQDCIGKLSEFKQTFGSQFGMKVRYMPLEYAGFGYYTFGNQKLIVEDVEFIQ